MLPSGSTFDSMATLAPGNFDPAQHNQAQANFKPSPSPDQILAVKNVLAEYCFNLDGKNYDRLSKLFAPDCIAYYSAVAPGSNAPGFKDSPFIGREAVIAFLFNRTHDKTTVHNLSTQYLDFEYHEDGTVAACVAKTYFTANTFTLPTAQNPNLVHTVQFGQYLDVLWPRDDEDKPGATVWGIYHRRVKIMVRY
jgi:hypothetical protein